MVLSDPESEAGMRSARKKNGSKAAQQNNELSSDYGSA